MEFRQKLILSYVPGGKPCIVIVHVLCKNLASDLECNLATLRIIEFCSNKHSEAGGEVSFSGSFIKYNPLGFIKTRRLLPVQLSFKSSHQMVKYKLIILRV